MITTVGNRCAFLANSHVGHDCRVGDHVILSNNVMLAGHVTVGDYAILGGGAAVIQFARVGAHAFVGGLSGLENDLIPYGMALGNRAALAGLNIVGLSAGGFSREADPRSAPRLPAAVRAGRHAEGTGRGCRGRVRGPSRGARDPRLHPRGRRPGDLHAKRGQRRRGVTDLPAQAAPSGRGRSTCSWWPASIRATNSASS